MATRAQPLELARRSGGVPRPSQRWARASDRWIASDPGWVRLRMAASTASTLAVSLGVLYVITTLAGQPFTVAMLGVVVSMISSMALDTPDVRERALTAVLMLAISAAAVTLGAFLAQHKVLGDVVFVAIMVVATYARRSGMQGTMLGMVGFMTYFFALFLGAKPAMLGWLILALAIGMLVSFAMRTFVLRDRPGRQLQRTLNALGARVGGVVDAVAEALAAGELSERGRRRLVRRVAGVSETALMVESEIEDFDLRSLWPAMAPEDLSLRLFDVELATEQLAGAGRRAVATAVAGDDAHDRLVRALGGLRAGLRRHGDVRALREAGELAEGVHRDPAASPAMRSLAVAVGDLLGTIERARELDADPDARALPSPGGPVPPGPGTPEGAASDASPLDEPALSAGDSLIARMPPSARQAIQVGIASSLAIVAGELLSSARWYWAVIAAFVVFSGTSSRGETLTKGWQRVLGTVAGVAVGAVVASVVGGNTPASIILIFLCLFAGFYLIKVAYGLMVFWVSTMLALLYGLLGQFSVGLLLTRIEETAIGAAIGILVAALVLPTSTRASVDQGLRTFLSELGGLVGRGGDRLAGEPIAGLTSEARALDRALADLRASAKPLTSGVAGVNRRSSVRRAVSVMSACDHYARALARVSEAASSGEMGDRLRGCAEQVKAATDALAGELDGRPIGSPRNAAPLLDDAREALDRDPPPESERRRLTAALGCLRQLDLAVAGLARDVAEPVAPDDAG